MHLRSRRLRATLAGVAVVGAAGGFALTSLSTTGASAALLHADKIFAHTQAVPTVTPIKHVVVIFDENVSFDHYFGTYPDANNTSGEPFYAAPGTPAVVGNYVSNPSLLTSNPNASNPTLLKPNNVNNVLTCDQNHSYTPEENAFNGGAMNDFEASDGTATTTGNDPEGQPCAGSEVMDYYDGNTVTAEWNYAQHFAMSDDNYGSTFGPSTEGALNVISGNTGGADTAHAVRSVLTDGDTVNYTNPDGGTGTSVIGDAQPYWDDCSTGAALALNGINIGNQLNAAGLSWGWFQGGFTPNSSYSGPVSSVSTYDQLNNPNKVACSSSHDVGAALGGTGSSGANPWGTTADYSAHYDGFQFYASTANPHHLAPTSLDVVGTDTSTPGEFNTANHNYDVTTFNSLMAGIQNRSIPQSHMPAVTYLKAPVYETGHPATSDPVDEQTWLTTEINQIEALPTWSSTAIFVTYDDSDGWYDQAYSGVTNPSDTTADSLTGTDACGTVPTSGSSQDGTTPLYNEEGRCGYGPRLPLIVISPYARQDYIQHTITDQSSIVAFIEYNWNLGQIPGSFANISGGGAGVAGGGGLLGMFNFNATGAQLASPLILNTQTGEPSNPIEGTISPTTGPNGGGNTVTISGMNFSTTAGQTVVKFGGVKSKTVSCSASATMSAPATVCTAVAPVGSGGETVPITVTVNGTVAVNDAGEYTYTG